MKVKAEYLNTKVVGERTSPVVDAYSWGMQTVTWDGCSRETSPADSGSVPKPIDGRAAFVALANKEVTYGRPTIDFDAYVGMTQHDNIFFGRNIVPHIDPQAYSRKVYHSLADGNLADALGKSKAEADGKSMGKHISPLKTTCYVGTPKYVANTRSNLYKDLRYPEYREFVKDVFAPKAAGLFKILQVTSQPKNGLPTPLPLTRRPVE